MSRHRLHTLALIAIVASLPACAAETEAPPSAEADLTSGADVVFQADGTVTLPASLVAGKKIRVRRMNGRPNPCGSGLGEDFHVAGFAFDHRSGEIALQPGPAGANVALFEEGTMTVPDTGSVGFYIFVRKAIPGPNPNYCYDSNHGGNYVVHVAHH